MRVISSNYSQYRFKPRARPRLLMSATSSSSISSAGTSSAGTSSASRRRFRKQKHEEAERKKAAEALAAGVFGRFSGCGELSQV